MLFEIGILKQANPAHRILPARALFAASWLLMLVSCASQLSPSTELPNPDVTKYRLGVGDQVRVIIFDESQLSNSFTIGADGTIAFPLVGTLPAAGLTTHQLESSIAAALRGGGIINQPSVSVQVTQYRPISVLGEVNRPGQYPYQPGMTMLEAVALAGGFTYRSVTDHASDWRSSGEPSGQAVQGEIGPGSTLAPGDVISISERYF